MTQLHGNGNGKLTMPDLSDPDRLGRITDRINETERMAQANAVFRAMTPEGAAIERGNYCPVCAALMLPRRVSFKLPWYTEPREMYLFPNHHDGCPGEYSQRHYTPIGSPVLDPDTGEVIDSLQIYATYDAEPIGGE